MAGLPLKRSVAVVVRGPDDGTFLVVRRPDDPADPLAGAWGFPAVTLADGEDELAGVARAGRAKMGVELRAIRKIGETQGNQGGAALRLAEYEAVITAGVPSVPQPDTSVTQYTAWRYTAEPGDLAEAAGRGSLCARLFLQDRAGGRA
jgi:8-oxo-dGTP diphosphatase